MNNYHFSVIRSSEITATFLGKKAEHLLVILALMCWNNRALLYMSEKKTVLDIASKSTATKLLGLRLLVTPIIGTMASAVPLVVPESGMPRIACSVAKRRNSLIAER